MVQRILVRLIDLGLVEMYAMLDINALRDRAQVEMLMQQLLDVGMEGWLSASPLRR